MVELTELRFVGTSKAGLFTQISAGEAFGGQRTRHFLDEMRVRTLLRRPAQEFPRCAAYARRSD
jgi:hypothetical protein